MTLRRIAVVADDYGLHAGVDDAVLDLASRGRLTALSCMTGAPAWRADAPRLASLDRSRVDIGLHLDLTEFPITLQPMPLKTVIARSIARQLDAAALRREVDAQLDAFEAATGHAPDHVDGHQHVHQLPQVRDALMAALRARPGHRPWLRDTRRPAHESLLSKAGVIETLGASGLRRLAREAGLAQNGHLLGVYGFEPSAGEYAARMREWLRIARDGDALMCHPSRQADAPGDPILAARIAEANVLGSDEFAAMLRAADVSLVALGKAAA